MRLLVFVDGCLLSLEILQAQVLPQIKRKKTDYQGSHGRQYQNFAYPHQEYFLVCIAKAAVLSDARSRETLNCSNIRCLSAAWMQTGLYHLPELAVHWLWVS